MRKIFLSAAIIALITVSPLYAQEQLLTKLYFDNWLRSMTAPLESQIKELKTAYNSMDSTVRELKQQLLTEVKISIGKKTALVDGTARTMDVAPLISKDRTMVPVRFVGEIFGAEFAWDGKLSKATFVLDDVKIELSIDSKTAMVNGRAVALDSEPVIIEGRTMVPLRFVSEYMGASIDWDGQTRTATIYR
jgi:hypothetical protein